MSGRGRGRGRAPPTGARLLLQRSAQEAGLDANNLRNLQDITKPKLYPDYEWHSTGHKWDSEEPTIEPPAAKRSASTIYLINKSRELHHRFEQSPYYVRPTIESDVVRYGKRPRPVEPDISVLEHIPKMADPDYMPPELLQKTTTQLSMKELMATTAGVAVPAKSLTLEELAAQELQRRREVMDDQAEGNLSDIEVEEDEEEDEVADYTANYYASDDDDGGGDEGGGGDEATF